MADKIRFNSKLDLQDNYEPSDSENEYSTSEKQILDKLRKRKIQDTESEEELYAFSDSDEDSVDKNDLNIADSDVEGQEKSDDDLPDSKAWGNKKRSYYSTDYVDEDYGGFGDDENDALMEEEEAKSIQKRLIEQLGEEDYILEFYKEPVKNEGDSFIKSDVSLMSNRQKLQLLEQESPEFTGLVDEFKLKLTIAKNVLYPVLELIKIGKIPNCSAAKFVRTNYDLILNYCTNISFYLLLKSQRVNIQNHPVVKRLYQYRQMLKKIEPLYLEMIQPQIGKILNAIQNNHGLQIIKENLTNTKHKSNKQSKYPAKKLKLIDALEKGVENDTVVSDDTDEDEVKHIVNNNQSGKKDKIVIQSEESELSDNDEIENGQNQQFNTTKEVITEDIGDKREITYQIAKNKGLTPYRKKEQRNPRVKHKLKYRKAKIRRKGAVREPRTEIVRYGGEPSGIKANVKKSIKIK